MGKRGRARKENWKKSNSGEEPAALQMLLAYNSHQPLANVVPKLGTGLHLGSDHIEMYYNFP